MRRLIAALALGAPLACAQPGYPPGGPEDLAPPVLVEITPDTAATNVRSDRVLFTFDEVVEERQPQDLARLFLISPRDGEVEVDWRRRSLAVRPQRGRWRPNTTYTVTLFPGVRDLRGNPFEEGATTWFATGPIIHDAELRGVAFDWTAGRELPLAFVEAIARPDSTVFVTRADSAGRFILPHLRVGIYTVRAFADPNANRLLDPREAWDTVQVSLTDTGTVALYAFVQDTIGPGMSDVRHRDSLAVSVTVDRSLDVDQAITPQLFTILDPDSVPVPIADAMSSAEWAELQRERADTAVADTAASDTAGARPVPPAPPDVPAETPADTLDAPWPTFDRPRPVTEIVLRLAEPLAPETQYRIVARELRSLAGYTRTSERTFTTPPRAPPPQPTDTLPPPPPPPTSDAI